MFSNNSNSQENNINSIATQNNVTASSITNENTSEMLSPPIQLDAPFDIEKESEFIQNCSSGNLEKVGFSLEKDPSLISRPATNGSYPLMFAAEKGHLDLVKLLIEKKAIIDTSRESGPNKDVTALWFAAIQQRWDVVLKLLEAGAKNLDAAPESGRNKGLPALWWAAYYKQWDVVLKLLEAGAKNLDATPESGSNKGKTALWWAANQQQCDVILKLLEAGAKNLDAAPESGSNKGKSALWWAAAYWQRWDVVLKLLEAGAKNLDATLGSAAYKGITILWIAAYYKQWDVVLKLLEAGAKNLDAAPESGPSKGLPALWWAAYYKQWDVVLKLLEAGAKSLDAAPESGSNKGKNALYCATYLGQVECVSALLKRGASLDVDKTNQLLSIVQLGKRDVRLPENGEHDNSRKIILAAEKLFKLAESTSLEGLEEVLNILQTALNGRRNNNTAIQVAIKQKNTPFIERLVMAGANLSLKNADGLTAQQLANEETFPILLAFGTLEEIEEKLDTLKFNLIALKHQENKELEEHNRLLLDNLALLCKKTWELGEKLEQPYKNKLCYRLGALLFEQLPNTITLLGFIEKSLKSVCYSEDSEVLFKHAKAILLELQLNKEPNITHESEGLDEELSPAEGNLMKALQAGNKVPNDQLSHIAARAILGDEYSMAGLKLPTNVSHDMYVASLFQYLLNDRKLLLEQQKPKRLKTSNDNQNNNVTPHTTNTPALDYVNHLGSQTLPSMLHPSPGASTIVQNPKPRPGPMTHHFHARKSEDGLQSPVDVEMLNSMPILEVSLNKMDVNIKQETMEVDTDNNNNNNNNKSTITQDTDNRSDINNKKSKKNENADIERDTSSKRAKR